MGKRKRGVDKKEAEEAEKKKKDSEFEFKNWKSKELAKVRECRHEFWIQSKTVDLLQVPLKMRIQKIDVTDVKKNDVLIRNYTSCYFDQMRRQWQTAYKDHFVAFCSSFFDRRVQISIETLLFLVQSLMDKFFWKNDPPGHMIQDIEYLNLLMKAFFFVPEEQLEVGEWFPFLSHHLSKRIARKEFHFLLTQWKRSHKPNNQISRLVWNEDVPKDLKIPNANVAAESGLSEMIVKWYAEAPISLLDTWLSRMENAKGGLATFNIQVPNLFHILTALQPQLGPVRWRLLERAFSVCNKPFFVTLHDYGIAYPDSLAQIIRTVPILYYQEPATELKDHTPTWPKISADIQTFLSRNILEAFYLRMPPVVCVNVKNTTVNLLRHRLYEDPALFQTFRDMWFEGAQRLFPKEIANIIFIDYIRPLNMTYKV